MTDIFLSYANKDLERARQVALALEARGWSVWWDRKIPPGKTFDDVIEEHLDAARCVVTLWTKNSAQSDWVRSEAAEGVHRGCLVPALLEQPLTIPLAFRRIQAANLVDWEGQAGHPGFETLVQAVQGLLGPGSAAPAAVEPDEPPPVEKRPRNTAELPAKTTSNGGGGGGRGGGKGRSGLRAGIAGLAVIAVAVLMAWYWWPTGTTKPVVDTRPPSRRYR